MGMFDTIIINKDFKLPLPDDLGELSLKDIYTGGFQTKDLDNLLSTYDLNSDGSIFDRNDKWYGDLDETFIRANSPIPLSAPQSINFYCYIHEDEFEYDYMLEWLYYYDSDPSKRLITLLKFEKWSNFERKENTKKWNSEMEARKKLFDRRYMKIYLFYAKIIRIIFQFYRKVKNKLPSDFKIEQWLTPL